MLGISGVKGSGTDGAAVVSAGYGQGAGGSTQLPAVVFTGEESRIAMVAMDAVAALGKDRSLVPTSTALGAASVQAKLTQPGHGVTGAATGRGAGVHGLNAEAVAEVVKKVS